MTATPISRRAIHDEMQHAKADFGGLLANASRADLRRRSNGTKWTNRQLLFHMLLGYVLVRALLGLMQLFSRLPDRFSRKFASILNAGARPFHVINYLGSCGGALVLRDERLVSTFGRTVDSLGRRLDGESDAELARAMYFPVDWDPYFSEVMTLGAVYHYGTQHFAHHRRQLTIPDGSDDESGHAWA